jgi:hypothetical protein
LISPNGKLFSYKVFTPKTIKSQTKIEEDQTDLTPIYTFYCIDTTEIDPDDYQIKIEDLDKYTSLSNRLLDLSNEVVNYALSETSAQYQIFRDPTRIMEPMISSWSEYLEVPRRLLDIMSVWDLVFDEYNNIHIISPESPYELQEFETRINNFDSLLKFIFLNISNLDELNKRLMQLALRNGVFVQNGYLPVRFYSPKYVEGKLKLFQMVLVGTATSFDAQEPSEHFKTGISELLPVPTHLRLHKLKKQSLMGGPMMLPQNARGSTFGVPFFTHYSEEIQNEIIATKYDEFTIGLMTQNRTSHAINQPGIVDVEIPIPIKTAVREFQDDLSLPLFDHSDAIGGNRNTSRFEDAAIQPSEDEVTSEITPQIRISINEHTVVINNFELLNSYIEIYNDFINEATAVLINLILSQGSVQNIFNDLSGGNNPFLSCLETKREIMQELLILIDNSYINSIQDPQIKLQLENAINFFDTLDFSGPSFDVDYFINIISQSQILFLHFNQFQSISSGRFTELGNLLPLTQLKETLEIMKLRETFRLLKINRIKLENELATLPESVRPFFTKLNILAFNLARNSQSRERNAQKREHLQQFINICDLAFLIKISKLNSNLSNIEGIEELMTKAIQEIENYQTKWTNKYPKPQLEDLENPLFTNEQLGNFLANIFTLYFKDTQNLVGTEKLFGLENKTFSSIKRLIIKAGVTSDNYIFESVTRAGGSFSFKMTLRQKKAGRDGENEFPLSTKQFFQTLRDFAIYLYNVK